MSTIVNNDVWFDAIVASKHCNIMLLLRLWFPLSFTFPSKSKFQTLFPKFAWYAVLYSFLVKIEEFSKEKEEDMDRNNSRPT